MIPGLNTKDTCLALELFQDGNWVTLELYPDNTYLTLVLHQDDIWLTLVVQPVNECTNTHDTLVAYGKHPGRVRVFVPWT